MAQIAKEFEERVIKLNRVSKKTTGGSALSFTALVALGDKNGRVGFGYAKAKDVSGAITKATTAGKRSMVTVTRRGTTIPHEVVAKSNATEVFIKPAPEGAGIIAGGAVRQLFELAGIQDVSAKIFGSTNKLSSLQAAMMALKKLRS